MAINDMTIQDYSTATKTDSGTKIVKKGQELGKEAFLTILAAQLSNQDPSKETDSSQYISQMAQFASMEQMTNLNETMTNSVNQNLVGKGVTLSILDSNGVAYTGVVQTVTSNSSGTSLTVEVNDNGTNTYIDANVDQIVTVVNVSDYSIPPLTNMDGNMQFLVASSFLNKNVELTDVDSDGENLTGTVKGVYKESGAIKMRVELASGETIEVAYANVTKVGEFEE
ncbi:flagellar hook assembly protein FlgD [Clostridium vincentii]|uniref:Basal-body rod modification protein FlgD n=1 Tax=Clostridium vincentii TaxID=52704 RepID=A0A2T0BJF1_9CLOT|nr:flagellar hook capping FlgD N-terminal domain-containing protein [Clostridium vincentii]PRR83977.1 flagellar basal body rod modification protein [Clostridium vincentii]